LFLLAPSLASAQVSAAGLDLRLNVKIPLRDGVRLNATLYLPPGAERSEPGPVILAMTPYTADSYHRFVIPIVRRGYVVAVVDVRGRGGSEGSFDPFAQESRDGYDTVEWLARQPWCNGKVGMMGGSYGGFNQWAIAKELPPHLATIAPTAAPFLGIDWPALGGIWPSYMIQWLAFTSGQAANTNLFADVAFWRAKFRDRYERHLPFGSLDSIVGLPSPVFQTWMAHPDYDDYWARMSPSPDQLGRMALPILTRTGMYDNAQVGAMEHYRNHMRYGTADAKASHYLMIGPWDHGGTRTPQRSIGDVSLGPAAVFDMGELEADWYDWTLRGGPRPKLLAKRVAYYVTGAGPGADGWKYADSLEAIGREVTHYFLTSAGGGARDLTRPGVLVAREPGPSPPDEWTHDPLDTSAAREGVVFGAARALVGRGVVYQTAPFQRPSEISGIPSLRLWLTFNVPDADLAAEIHEITPEGKSVLLSDARLRARYRNSLARPAPLVPGEPTRIDLDRFRFMSRVMAKGSRIRLVVRSPTSIDLETNYNSGGLVSAETAADARTARIKVHHEPGRYSVLVMPIAGR
jgi:putative CocE/NonD family hydrolase